MPVTGVFNADFSNFDKAVKTSQEGLKSLESAAGQVQSSVVKMTKAQEEMLNQIGASGGRIQDLGTEAGKAGGEVKTLSESYRQFDGILSAAGINIGPQIKGLEDMANMAGKTAAELGAIGTAGAIAGAAVTGWNFGKLIADWTDWDDKIGDVLISLLGLPDVLTDSERRAKIMSMAVESSGRMVNSLSEAMKILADVKQVAADKAINWTDKLFAARAEVEHLTERQRIQIEVAQMAGATTEQITNKFGISAQALKILTDQTDKAAAAQAKLTAEHEKDLALAEKRQAANVAGVELMERDARLMADRNKFDAEQLAIQNQKLAAGKGYVEQMGQIAKVNADAVAFDKQLVTEQAALEQSNQELIASFSTMTEAHVEAGAAAEAGTAATVQGYQAVAQQVEITSDGVKGWLELMRATNAANALLSQNSLFTTGSTLENQSRIGTAFSPIPGFASGVENFEGGLAKVHGGEVLANLPRGTSVFPRGSVGGANVSNVFNLVDTESNLAKRVAEMIMRQVRAGTQLGTT